MNTTSELVKSIYKGLKHLDVSELILIRDSANELRYKLEETNLELLKQEVTN